MMQQQVKLYNGYVHVFLDGEFLQPVAPFTNMDRL